jgi:hypothetical protein
MFVCSGPYTLDIGAMHKEYRNVVFRGSDYPKCLTRSFPCSQYLDRGSRDLVEWFAEEYSSVVPESEKNTFKRVSESKFNKSDTTKLHQVQLEPKESLSDMATIVERVLGMHTNITHETSEGDTSEESEDEEVVSDTDDSIWWWIFCTDRRWHRMIAVEPFRGDAEYRLVWLENGNMLRMKVSEFGTDIALTSEDSPVDEPVDMPNSTLLERQIYIYNCMDGYWEYTGPGGPLFPCRNPSDTHYPEQFCGTSGSSTRVASELLNTSGILSEDAAATFFDMPSTDELLNTLLADNGGTPVVEASQDESDTNSEPEPIIREVKPMIQRKAKPTPIDPSSILPTHEWIDPLPGKKPRDVAKRQSGVQGVTWDDRLSRVCFGVIILLTPPSQWYVRVQIAGKTVLRYFPCRGSLSEVETALDEAIRYLSSELLPKQAAWQRSQTKTCRESGMRYISWSQRDRLVRDAPLSAYFFP